MKSDTKTEKPHCLLVKPLDFEGTSFSVSFLEHSPLIIKSDSYYTILTFIKIQVYLIVVHFMPC